jgi:hypothetical protein
VRERERERKRVRYRQEQVSEALQAHPQQPEEVHGITPFILELP